MSKRHISMAVSALKLLITIFVLVFMYKYILENKDDFEIFTNRPSITLLLSIFVLYLTTVLTQARILLSAQNQENGFLRKSLVDAGFVNCCSTMVGYFLPTGAMVSKVFLLNRVFKTSKTEGAEIVGRITHIQILTSVVLGLVVFFTYWLFYGFRQEHSLLLNSVLILFTAFLVVFFVLIKLKSSRLGKNKLVEFFFLLVSKIKANSKSQLFTIGGLHIFQQVIFAIILMVYFDALTQHIDWFQAIFLVSVSSLTLFISLTPGNIGVREGIYFYLASLIGVDSASLVAVLLFDRVVQMLMILLFAILLYLCSSIRQRS